MTDPSPNYPTPADLKGCRRGAEWAAVVSAAQDIGLFDALADGPSSTSALAAQLDLGARALDIVIGVLDALGLVKRDGRQVAMSAEGRARFLDPDSGVYEAVASRRWKQAMQRWIRLDAALTSEGAHPDPAAAAAGSDADNERLASFMAAMASKPDAQVGRLADACLERCPWARTALDLGGGPGLHSRAFARRGLTVTLYDRPETIDHVARAYGLRDLDGIELLGGDFLSSLPSGSFDIVLLANITHIHDADTNRQLVSRLATTQPAGGLIAILDFVRGISPFAPLFAVTMLLNTEGGDTYPLEAYQDWLYSAGYGETAVENLDPDRQLITALRTA